VQRGLGCGGVELCTVRMVSMSSLSLSLSLLLVFLFCRWLSSAVCWWCLFVPLCSCLTGSKSRLFVRLSAWGVFYI
jgi:hypothetical protein